MGLMLVCGAAVLGALIVAAGWRTVPYRPGWSGDGSPPTPTIGHAVGAAARQAVLVLISGVPAGLLVAGAGGRLVMRLLAVTAGDGAQGRLTEAGEVVGRISVDGTVGLIIFVGIGAGVLTAAAYAILRRALPAGLSGGLVLGVVLLAVAGPGVDPIRADNPDFGIVGPGWLGLVAFLLLAVVQGVVSVAAFNRASASIPLPGRRPLRAWVPYAVLAVVVVPGPGVALVVLVPMALAALAVRFGLWARLAGRPVHVRWALRVSLLLVLAAGAPRLVEAVSHIAAT